MFALSEPLALRLAEESDREFFSRLYATTRDDLRRLPMPQKALDDLIKMQQVVQENGLANTFPEAKQLTITLHGEAIGRLIVDYTKNDWRVIDIALMPPFRLQGHGRKVMQAVMDKARETAGTVSLAVFEFNTIARHLYNKLAFQVVHEDPVHAQMIWRSAA